MAGGQSYYSTDSGTTWNPADAPAYRWSSVAASASGTKLVAVAADDTVWGATTIYLSSDSGAHWTPSSAPSNYWASVACSSDGMKIVAFGIPDEIDTGLIYTSTNAGTNWTVTTVPAGARGALASSADGAKRFLASGSGGIYTDAVWTPWTKSSAPDTNFWSRVVSSADGSKLVAAVHGVTNNIDVCGPIYRSADSGATWQLTGAPIGCWNSLASSADGTRLVAAESAWVYTSADAGLTWRSNNVPFLAWTAVASSSDGIKLALAASGGGIYTSTNSGSNWTQSASAPSSSSTYWNAIASSADGRKLAATVGSTYSSGLPAPGMIYTSPDSGTNWNLMNAPQALWAAIASSADGTRLIAAPIQDAYRNGLPIYTSTNSGVTWITNNTPAEHWVCVSSSADGTRLAAATTSGAMYVSTNSGAIWSSSATPYQQWQSVAWSDNGNQLVGVVSYGGIYLLQSAVPAASPVLNISRSGNQAFLTWLTNAAAGFQLQQNTNLATTNWTAIGTVPMVTNLLYQVIVSPTNRQDFYRLKYNY